jgi:hypothetical protein
LQRPEVDVCVKDPGYAVDITIQGDIAVFVAIFLGHVKWDERIGKTISLVGERVIAQRLPVWFGL